MHYLSFMATDCPAFSLPAPLAATLTALRSARGKLSTAELCHLLAASTVMVAQRDLSPLTDEDRVRAELDAEHEQIAFHEARAVLLAIVDFVLDAAEPYLPANDQCEDQAAE